jgi:hypothetical protein
MVGGGTVSARPTPPGPSRKDGALTDALVEAVGSHILAGGQWLLTEMKRTLGDGDPDDGRAFGAAAEGFRSADAELGGAVAADHWAGEGADAYADQNARQRLRAESAADADREVHRVLAGEAYQVSFHRRQIDELYNWLGELSEYTRWLDLVPRYGDAAKLVVESAAVHTALASAGFEVANMHQEAADNADKLKDLVGRYQAIAAGAELPDGGFGGPGGGPAGPPDAEPDDLGAMGGAVGAAEDLAKSTGVDTADQPGPPAALAGLFGMAGALPALATAFTAPLAALLAPAGGLVAAAVQAAAQGVAAGPREHQPDDEDESEPDPSSTAVPDELIHVRAEDSGPGGSDPANVNPGHTPVSDAATQPPGR